MRISDWSSDVCSSDLRGYAQKQPKQEYKREAFELFEQMLEKVQVDVITILARIRVRSEEEMAQIEEQERQRQKARPMEFQHADPGSYSADEEAAQAQAAEQGRVAAASHEPARAGPKIGRNDPCPCGSGTL